MSAGSVSVLAVEGYGREVSSAPRDVRCEPVRGDGAAADGCIPQQVHPGRNKTSDFFFLSFITANESVSRNIHTPMRPLIHF